MKKVILYMLGVLMAVLTVVVSSGISISFMRCHFSGKIAFNEKCISHEADHKAETIIHQNCCDFGSLDFNIDIKNPELELVSSIQAPMLFEINEVIPRKSLAQKTQFSFLDQYLPPPSQVDLQIFII